MIAVSRLDGKEYYVNAELIETVETTPDTVVTLTNGKKLVVREAASEVVERVIGYKRSIMGSA